MTSPSAAPGASAAPSAISFPPAVNWYCSQAMSSLAGDESRPGVLAYAAKGDLAIIRQDNGLLLHLVRDACGDTSRAKLVSVRWSSSPDLLAASTDAGKVFLWTVEWSEGGEVAVKEARVHDRHVRMQGENARQRQSPSCRVSSTCFLVTQPRILVSGDDSGALVTWDSRVNAVRAFPGLCRSAVTALEASRDADDVVAVGTKSGMVQIVKLTGSGTVLHRLRCTDSPIDSLSWQPVVPPKAPSEADKPQPPLLAVSAKDGTIGLWHSASGHQVAQLLTGASRGRNGGARKGFQQQQQNEFMCCSWLSDKVLLSGGANAELLKWNIDLGAEGSSSSFGHLVRLTAKDHASVVHRTHRNQLFTIECSEGRVHTTGQDRAIVTVNAETMKVILHLPTLAHWPLCLSPCPVESSTLAVGAGDRTLRLWRSAAKDAFDVTPVVQRAISKVTCAAWHPTSDRQLALGTDEGRVCIIIPQKVSAPPTMCGFKHRGQVYSVLWARKAGGGQENDSAPLMLYSVGDGRVMMQDPSDPNANGIDLDSLVERNGGGEGDGGGERKAAHTQRTEICLHPDGNLLAVGSEDGSVELLSLASLTVSVTLKAAQKLIQCLRWHPEFQKDGSESKFHSWLAVASNEADVHVFDLGRHLGDGQQHKVLTEPDIVLRGHHLRVIMVDWSPHHDGRLVSVSYDGTAQVWDAAAGGAPVANFSAHHGRLYCCLWSPTDPDLVYTGAEDFTLRGWRVSEQKEMVPRKKKGKAVPAVKVGQDSAGEAATKEASDPSRKSGKKRSAALLPLLQSAMNKASPKRDVEDSLAIYQMEEDAELEEGENGEGVLGDNGSIALFYGPATVESIIQKEASSHTSAGAHDASAQLSLWSGDVGERVRAAMASGHLTEWMVSAAASVSRDFWAEACEAFALQLAAAGDAAKAASYYLMVHKVEEAIRVLKKAEEFAAAVAVAKIRLDPEHPLLKELFSAWASHATGLGQVSTATKCWLAAGEAARAAANLSKRPEPAALRAAAQIYKEVGEEERARLLALQGVALCAKQGNEEERGRLVELFPEVALEKLAVDDDKGKDQKEEEGVGSSQGETKDEK